MDHPIHRRLLDRCVYSGFGSALALLLYGYWVHDFRYAIAAQGIAFVLATLIPIAVDAWERHAP